jgi:hypothetical protein
VPRHDLPAAGRRLPVDRAGVVARDPAEAQSFFTVMQQGFSVLALVAFGWLAGHLGAHAWFVLAAIAAAGAVPVWYSLRLKQPSA